MHIFSIVHTSITFYNNRISASRSANIYWQNNDDIRTLADNQLFIFQARIFQESATELWQCSVSVLGNYSNLKYIVTMCYRTAIKKSVYSERKLNVIKY